MVDESLAAVGLRQQLVLVTVDTDADADPDESVLEYALSGIFTELFGDNNDNAGAWTLRETESMHLLISAVLQRLAAGPADQPFAEQLLQKITDAIEQINNNLAFTLEELLADIEQAEPLTP